MRLLHTTTLQLTDFVGKAPPYAILSHTWGEEEVLFADISNPDVPKAGWAKVRSSCDLARNLGHDWIWIDTCCIDKSSSAELSEAINSMFRFYQKAVICIAYLSDVPYSKSEAEIPNLLRESRWFTRGWTLQELLAPRHLDFYSSGWKLLGSLNRFRDLIAEVTGIQRSFIGGAGSESKRLGDASVAARMSWASRRRTTRLEDIAYCLLGIFGINMPLIYGEGERAFTRLQQAIIHEIDDQSIFAWGYEHVGEPLMIPAHGWSSPLLAGNPSWFKDAWNIVPFETMNIPWLISSGGNGVTISTPLLQQVSQLGRYQFSHLSLNEHDGKPLPFGAARLPCHETKNLQIFLAPLRCARWDDPFNSIAIPLNRPDPQDSAFDDAFSFYRASHAVVNVPRNVWVLSNICKPFVYFRSSYERRGTPVLKYWQDKGCMIRTIPRGYNIAPTYFKDHRRRHGVPDIIKPNNDTILSADGKGSLIVVMLEGKSLPNIALTLRFVFDPNKLEYGSLKLLELVTQLDYMPPSSSLEDFAYMTPKTRRKHTCDTFAVKVTQSEAYGPHVWLVDILDPQGNNVSRETDALTGLFRPVRAQDFRAQYFDNRGYASKIFETQSLTAPSYSEGVVSMESQTGADSHVGSRSSSPTIDGYTSQEL